MVRTPWTYCINSVLLGSTAQTEWRTHVILNYKPLRVNIVGNGSFGIIRKSRAETRWDHEYYFCRASPAFQCVIDLSSEGD